MVSKLDHDCFQFDQLVFGNGSSWFIASPNAIDRELYVLKRLQGYTHWSKQYYHTCYRDRAPINYFIHAWDLSASRALILFCTFYVTSLSRCIVFRISVRLRSIITSLINSIFTSGKKQRADIVRDNIFTISSIVHNSHKSVYLDFHLVNNVTLVVIFVWYINRTQSQCLSTEARFSVSWVDQRHLCIWLWYFIPDSAFLVFDRFKNFSEL